MEPKTESLGGRFLILEVQPNNHGRWRRLGIGPDEAWASNAMGGWMAVYTGSWRTTKVKDMANVQALLKPLRARQSRLDAPGVLLACEQAGVRLWVENGKPLASGPLGSELRDDLIRCRDEVLKLLSNVPAWDEVENKKQQARVGRAIEQASESLTGDDRYALAARTVLSDALAAVSVAASAGRLDRVTSHADWIVGWLAGLSKTMAGCRATTQDERVRPEGWLFAEV